MVTLVLMLGCVLGIGLFASGLHLVLWALWEGGRQAIEGARESRHDGR